MSHDPRQAADYSSRQVLAARMVLVDLGQVLAAFRARTDWLIFGLEDLFELKSWLGLPLGDCSLSGELSIQNGI
jgi:hypothetical protein